MKLNIGDVVNVQLPDGGSVRVAVEDSSKGDEIQGKVESANGQGAGHYSVGQVYVFERKHIVNG